MAVPVIEDEMVSRSMFDEAIRTGATSASFAIKNANINRVAVDAIHTALELLKVGRAGDARDRLDRALVAITRMSTP